MTQLTDMIESLLIFQRYSKRASIYAEHDMLYMDIATVDISSVDFNRLRELGWFQKDVEDESVYDPEAGWCYFV